MGYITQLLIHLLLSNSCTRYNIAKNEYQAEITLPTILLQASSTGSNDTIYILLKTLNIKITFFRMLLNSKVLLL
jgi:hypothetical protein